MNFPSLELLVKETLDHSEQIQLSKREEASLSMGDMNSYIRPSKSAGVFFKLERKAPLFLIRILAVPDLSEAYDQILGSPQSYPRLRLDQDKDMLQDQLLYMETESVELAKKLQLQFGGKRFSLFEEHIFNVSDHSDFWWLKVGDQQIEISFKLNGKEADSDFVKVGALVDEITLKEFFRSNKEYLSRFFGVERLAVLDSKIIISSSNTEDTFEGFKDIFRSGLAENHFWEVLDRRTSESFDQNFSFQTQFLFDLNCLRKFWNIIALKLESHTEIQ